MKNVQHHLDSCSVGSSKKTANKMQLSFFRGQTIIIMMTTCDNGLFMCRYFLSLYYILIFLYVPSSNMSVLFTIYNQFSLHSRFFFLQIQSKHQNIWMYRLNWLSVVRSTRYLEFSNDQPLSLIHSIGRRIIFLSCFFFDFFIVNYYCVAGSFISNLYKLITNFAFYINNFLSFIQF